MHKILVHLPFYLFQTFSEIIITILSCISTNTVAHIYPFSLNIEHNFNNTCPYKDTTNALKYRLCKSYL